MNTETELARQQREQEQRQRQQEREAAQRVVREHAERLCWTAEDRAEVLAALGVSE